MAVFIDAIRGLFNKPEAFCNKCKRYESRPEWVKKAKCSLCHGPLVPGPHTNY